MSIIIQPCAVIIGIWFAIFNIPKPPPIKNNADRTVRSVVNFLNLLIGFCIVSTVVFAIILSPALLELLVDICKQLVEFVVDNIVVAQAYAHTIIFLLIFYGIKNNWMYLCFLNTLCFAALVGAQYAAYDIENTLSYSFLMCCATIPLALWFDSELFGFISVLTFYWGIGARFMPIPFGYLFGFDNDNTLYRAMWTSLIMSIIGFFCRNNSKIKPFLRSLYVVGPIVYFTAHIIVTSWWVCSSTEKGYILPQIYMIMSLILCGFIGEVYAISGYKIMCRLFGILYGSTKIMEIIMIGVSNNTSLFLMCISGLSACLCAYLKFNPHLLKQTIYWIQNININKQM